MRELWWFVQREGWRGRTAPGEETVCQGTTMPGCKINRAHRPALSTSYVRSAIPGPEDSRGCEGTQTPASAERGAPTMSWVLRGSVCSRLATGPVQRRLLLTCGAWPCWGALCAHAGPRHARLQMQLRCPPDSRSKPR